MKTNHLKQNLIHLKNKLIRTSLIFLVLLLTAASSCQIKDEGADKSTDTRTLKPSQIPGQPADSVGDESGDSAVTPGTGTIPVPDEPVPPVVVPVPPMIFNGADLEGVSFQYAKLNGVDFRNANLNGVDFTGADVENADFTGAYNFDPTTQLADAVNKDKIIFTTQTRRTGYVLRAHSYTTQLVGASYRSNNMTDTNFENYRLINADFTGANMNGVNLKSAGIISSVFSYSVQTNVDYSDAILTGCVFSYVNNP